MVNKKVYIPKRGDLVWINFSPQKGREQANKRPAVVISPKIYNEKTGLALMCPITSQIKGYPFEFILKEKKIKGAVLCDHIKNLDYKAREVSFIQKLKDIQIKEIQEKIIMLISK